MTTVGTSAYPTSERMEKTMSVTLNAGNDKERWIDPASVSNQAAPIPNIRKVVAYRKRGSS
jgi:hypothetical protein